MDDQATLPPLADRLRPQTLDEVIGQAHLIGKGKPLRLMLENRALRSILFWGPPGVGKTTLARIIASQTGRRFFQLSAVDAGKADVRAVIKAVEDDNAHGAILFLDEIHRFNKAQQDYLLPFVENGTIVLIGATTENPRSLSSNRSLTRKWRKSLRGARKRLRLRSRPMRQISSPASPTAMRGRQSICWKVQRRFIRLRKSPSITSKTRCNPDICATTKVAKNTSTRSAPTSKVCAPATLTQHYIISRAYF
jgi:hypothetical protein